jgi:DNA-binding SARP family transcriptional activator/Tfp pilus assembly protein PilF
LSYRSEPAVRLNVLGRLELIDGGAVPLNRILAQPKRLALLIYLAAALRGGHHRRDSMRSMFWPELEHARANRALRQALHFLRTHLPAGSIVTRGTNEVGVEPGSMACDSILFLSAVDHGREEDALALYHGDLLPAFNLPDAPDFDLWLEMERERLRRRACRAASVLSEQCRGRGEHRQAAEWARLAADHAPLDESVQAEAGSLLARAGDPAGAIRVLQAASSRLREAGIESSPTLRELEMRIRSGQTPDLHHAPSVSVNGGTRPQSRQAVPAEASRLCPPGAAPAEPANLDAYHAYLRGRHLSRQRTPASAREAIEQYHTALRLDPGLAVAHSGLAEVWSLLPVYSAYPPADAFPRARQHAAKAIALDAALPEAHAMLAFATVCYEWDWTKAELEFTRALELGPPAPEVWVPYALYLLTPTGRFQEAVRAIQFARRLAPTSPAENAYVAMVCYHARMFDRALVEAKLALEMNERFPLGWWALGFAQEQTGRVDDAVASFERALELTAGSPLMLAQLGRACARAGHRLEAEQILDRLLEQEGEAGPTPYFTASILAALGRVTPALESLERAYAQRVPHMVFLGVAPEMDGLRHEKRFRELMLRLGLGSLPQPHPGNTP